MTQEDYYRIIFGPDFPGFISIWEKQSKITKFFNSSELTKMIKYIRSIKETCNVYFGCGLRADKDIDGLGKFKDIIAIPGFWMDIDLFDPDAHKAHHYPTTKEEVYKILKNFPLAPTIVNWSGHGLQSYWLFDKLWIFQDENERNEALALSRKFQDTIIAIFEDDGYKLDKTAALAHILRAPGTLNLKTNPAVPVKILKIKQDRRYTIQAIRNAVYSKQPPKPRILNPIKKNTVPETNTFPSSKVEDILQKCHWFRHCQTDSASLSEPEWFYMLTVVSFCENPLHWAYDLSKEYDGFDKKETRDKVVRIRETWTRPVTCDYISQNFGGDYCTRCPHNVKTPFQLGIDKSNDSLTRIGFIFDDEGHISSLNGNIFARYILHRLKLIYTEGGFFYQYSNGVWNRIEHNQLSRRLRNLVHEFAPDFWTKRREDLYLDALKREAPSKRLNFDRNVLNLENGMFDLSEYTLLPHNPGYLSSIQLSISHDENAVCPRFDEFLLSVFEGDKSLIRVVHEIMGYCLTAETSAQKAFFFYGQGSNGKSLLTEIIMNLCGIQNTSAIPLADLEKPFARYELVDKLLNISTENEVTGSGLNAGPFKAIVTGDHIQVEKKFEQSFMYRPFCKLIFSLNNLPYSRDKSWGFQRRLLAIPFNRTFRTTDADYKNYSDLRVDLLNELPGILNKSLLALKRLRKNNYIFSKSKAIEKLQLEYKHLQNPYSQFVAEVIKQGDETDTITNETMHRVFEKWCESNGHKKIASGSHLKRLIEIKKALKDAKIDFGDGKGHKSGGKRYLSKINLKTMNPVEVDDISELED